jgi:hypothetical protein
MASIVQEDDLIPEEDLEQPSETAEQRRAAIEGAPLPETAAPPIWNKKSRAGVRAVTGIALPMIATGGAVGGAGALRGMAGAAGAEALDALMFRPRSGLVSARQPASPPKEQSLSLPAKSPAASRHWRRRSPASSPRA